LKEVFGMGLVEQPLMEDNGVLGRVTLSICGRTEHNHIVVLSLEFVLLIKKSGHHTST
jgi:hypothetical protein